MWFHCDICEFYVSHGNQNGMYWSTVVIPISIGKEFWGIE